MKIRILSDLHLEFDLEAAHQTRLRDHDAPRPRYLAWDPGNTPADVLVLAGDILTWDMMYGYMNKDEKSGLIYTHFEGWFADRCEDYDLVIWVPGNHCYYDGRFVNIQKGFAEWTTKINEVAQVKGYKGKLIVGDRFTVMHNDVKFICATLWTDFMRGNPIIMNQIQNGLNDYNRINFKDHRLITPQILEEHQQSRAFIEQELNYDGKIVVVSHHAPSYQSVHPNFRGDVLNYAYFSDLDHLVERATLWCHGHTHSSFDYRIGEDLSKGQVVCNPRGYYPEGLNLEFDPNKVVDI